MLYLIGIVIAFFLSLLLVSKRGGGQADTILAAWLLVIGIHLLLFYVFISGQYTRFPFLLGIELPMPLVHGPFLFLYVTALTSSRLVKGSAFFHFVPVLIALFFLYPFFTLPAAEKITVYKNEGAEYEWLLSLLYGAILLSGIGYSLLSLQKLYHHQKNIGRQFSFTEKINLSWLRYLIWGSGIIWLVVIFGDDPAVYATITFYVVFIGYFGIKQVGIFTNVPPKTNEAGSMQAEFSQEEIQLGDPVFSEKVKYEKSGLTTLQIDSIHQQLVQCMRSEKLYKNPELTLAELAQHLEVHPNTLSQVINTREERNFFDYINGYRVEAFKQMAVLPESQKFTLLSLAFECGFNSKTSFNRNFKKATGLSPSEYLSQINVRLEPGAIST